MSESNKLNVYFEDQLVGELIRDEELTYSFSYSQNWLQFSGRFQLSLAMPFQSAPFGNKTTLSFFENLLPEGEVREVLAKSHHIESPFEFLKEFGQDCAGAVIVTPDSKSPYRESQEGQIKIDMQQVYRAIEHKQSVAEVIAEMDPGYLSLAGAQDKFPAIFKNNDLYLPTHGAPTTHIIKVPIYRSGVKESVYNEYYCMTLAGAVGLDVPNCQVLDDENHPLFIIERYDRQHETDSIVHRIHQQDFCQAQGVVSEQKYEAKGGPSIADNYQLIMKHVWIKKRRDNTFAFLDWVCFNLLIGNNDSHSKNLSLLLCNDKIELAPFYDMLCTAIYPKLKRQFSFSIGDRDDASRIGKNQLQMLEEQLGLKKKTMNERMRLMADQLMKHKDAVADATKALYPQAKIPARISHLIEDRCKSLTRQGLD